MTISKPDNQSEENVLAYAAITLCNNPALGSVPEAHEIAAWQDGTLPSKRSAEILSYVANDPVCFQQWLDIVEAQAWVEQEALTTAQSRSDEHSPAALADSASSNTQSSILSNVIQSLRHLFQQPIPMYGGAFAAVILAVLIVPLLNTGNGLTLQQQLDRSSDAYIDTGRGLIGSPPARRNTRGLGGLFDELSINDVERLHFQSGLQTFYKKLQTSSDSELSVSDAWQNWLAERPGDDVDCTKAINTSNCTAIADDFMSLGHWSLMTAAACEVGADQDPDSPGSDFWTDQYSIYENIRSVPAIAQSQIFATLLPSLETQTPDKLCAIAGSVLAAGK